MAAQQISSSQYVADLFSIKGQVVVMTGIARGLGLAIAEGVAQAGADIAGIDVGDEPSPAFKTLSKLGTRVEYYKSDVSDYEAINSTTEQIARDFGHIDACIPVAGIARLSKFADQRVEDALAVLHVNLHGVYFTVQACVKQFLRQGTGGNIVTIGSVSGRLANPYPLAAYVTSKHGVLGLTKQIALEYGEQGIRANSISPGTMLTDLAKETAEDIPGSVERWSQGAMLKRTGEPEELRGAAIFLLSKASSFVTGEDILVSGGMGLFHNW